METKKEILTITEVAEFLGLSKGAIYSKVFRREIPHYKRGKHLYFYRQEIVDWVMEYRIPTNEEILNN